MNKIVLDNGKYTVINELNEGGGFLALRYGEEWRSLAGDGLVLAMYHEIERLHEQLAKDHGEGAMNYTVMEAQQAEVERLCKQISEADILLKKAQQYDDELHNDISWYFHLNGGDSE